MNTEPAKQVTDIEWFEKRLVEEVEKHELWMSLDDGDDNEFIEWMIESIENHIAWIDETIDALRSYHGI